VRPAVGEGGTGGQTAGVFRIEKRAPCTITNPAQADLRAYPRSRKRPSPDQKSVIPEPCNVRFQSRASDRALIDANRHAPHMEGQRA